VTRVEAAHPDKKVRVWHQDEARFGQQGTLTRTWAATGSRPTAVRQTQYEYLWVLTAACGETGQAVGLMSPHLDAGVVNVFLEQFAREIPPDEHALLIWDGAGFHKAKALVIPPNVTLVYLPPYAPELNPVENLWHYLRSHYWSNRLYADYDALMDAATTAWRAVCLTASLIQSICACGYLPAAKRQELL
jgi:transposase